MAINKPDFGGLSAIFFNATLSKRPEKSHTDTLLNISKNIMEKNGVKTKTIRVIDSGIATGLWPDMTEHGWKSDTWPKIYEEVKKTDIVVLCGPIWLGDNSSEMKKITERLYSVGHELNEKGQYVFYGKVGGTIITGNEDGAKHCAMTNLYSLQHLGFTIPPMADCGWLGEIGPGPSYGDKLENGKRAGFDSDFTNRNTTFMTWNLMHLAKMLKQAGGMPAYGNQRSKWDAGSRFDFENPEYR